MGRVADEDWVRLGEGQGWVAFAATGPEEYGVPTLVRFKAAQIEGERAVLLARAPEFADELQLMHETLKGAASIESTEYDFRLTLEAKALGAVRVSARIAEQWGGPVEFELKYTFGIDQSYLPQIITNLRKQYPRAN